MNFVEPIRDRKRIAHIKNLLKGQQRYRELLLFVVGINSALRISDLLRLTIGDFVDERGQIRRRFCIRLRLLALFEMTFSTGCMVLPHSFRLADDLCVSYEAAFDMPQSDDFVTVLEDWLAAQGY